MQFGTDGSLEELTQSPQPLAPAPPNVRFMAPVFSSYTPLPRPSWALRVLSAEKFCSCSIWLVMLFVVTYCVSVFVKFRMFRASRYSDSWLPPRLKPFTNRMSNCLNVGRRSLFRPLTKPPRLQTWPVRIDW